MERRDLGIHTEMFNDGMVDLYEAGAVTGKRKTLWKGKMVGAFALGTKKLYDFMHNNLGVEFQQGKVTNDPYIIGKNYKMVSVNTAIQVDLYGQVCSQSMGHCHFSGTGGQLDTHRGAQLSPGGRGIIALHSAVKSNTISTIVPRLTEGAQITVASQDIDTVTTEYGVAELKGRTVKQRTEALIKIAHPDFRDWLRDEVERLEIVPRLIISGFEVMRPTRKATAPGVGPARIKLGTFCDLSGPNASLGMAALHGYTTYYEYTNHWGGIHGREIELIVEDDGFNPARTKLAIDKLIMEDEVFAIVNPLGTITNLAVMDYLVEREIPVISPHSGLSIWSTPLKRNYFALQPSYRVEGRILAQYALDELQSERIAVFHVADQFGQEGSTAFIEELRANGVEPVAVFSHKSGQADPEKWVEQLTAHKPALVLLYTYPKPAADLLLAAHERGFHPEWLSNYTLSGPDIFRFASKEASHGLRATSYPSGPRYNRAERLYSNLMLRNYADETPGTHSRIGYAAAQLVVEGLKRTGVNLTREGFISAMESIKDWSGGLLPPISYSENDHRGLTTLTIMRALHGRWIVDKGLLRLKE
jgi:ABC-type branched-subunit amino acid transport system substrate-binding protein